MYARENDDNSGRPLITVQMTYPSFKLFVCSVADSFLDHAEPNTHEGYPYQPHSSGGGAHPSPGPPPSPSGFNQ